MSHGFASSLYLYEYLTQVTCFPLGAVTQKSLIAKYSYPFWSFVNSFWKRATAVGLDAAHFAGERMSHASVYSLLAKWRKYCLMRLVWREFSSDVSGVCAVAAQVFVSLFCWPPVAVFVTDCSIFCDGFSEDLSHGDCFCKIAIHSTAMIIKRTATCMILLSLLINVEIWDK